jgi:isoleucyl-tRNA synthetase
MRYLLSNLYDFDPAERLPLGQMRELDRYALAQYSAMARAVLDAYRDYDFPTIFQRVNQFATVDLSAFYADVSKDCLYTFAATSPARRSAQTAMYVIVDGLVRILAPILPMTSDELWRHLPRPELREASVHVAEFPAAAELDAMADAALVEKWGRLLAARDEVNKALEEARQAKTIGNSLGARVKMRARGATAELLTRSKPDLAMLFIVSQLELETAAGDGPELEVVVVRAEGEKCPRCWRTVPSVSSTPGTEGLCDRCVDAIAATAGPVAG